MKAFVAFAVILILAIGGVGGFFGWSKMTKIEDWGVALPLTSELQEEEMEMLEKRYNQVLDQDDILEKAVEAHNLKDYYEVSSKEEAITKLKEDTFVRIPTPQVMHLLFTGKRSTRKERLAVTQGLSEDFRKRVIELEGR